GFTLIELMLVLSLLAMVMFLALPAFQAVLQGTVDKEVGRLTGVIRMLRNEAVLTRKPFRLVIDLKERQYWVEEWTLEGRYVERTTPAILAKHRFPTAMKIQDLILNGNTRYPLIDRRVDLVLDVSGFMDPFALRFAVDDVNYTLEFAGFTSDVNLVKADASK
ncbi:MAG TPA: prepilin-type N-terminal cleavage/methylation domain-containing protein, partial [bacterium]